MKNKIILEIRVGEGGDDAKLLVEDMTNIYLKSAKNNNFSYEIVEKRSGICVIWLTGNGVDKFYQNESGLHKFIRVPPTEKRGRTQTSTITVAIINPNNKFEYKLDRSNVRKQYTRGSGNGGQHRNKVETCVQLIDEATGIIIKAQDTRNRGKNEEIAWKRLEERIKSIESTKFDNKSYQERFDQIGYGNEKHRRTYRVKENMSIDHLTGKSCTFKDFSRGKIELLS